MKIYKDISFLFIAVLFNRFLFCSSMSHSLFRLELENTAVENIKPILNESTSNEIECYMKCLDNQGICCLLQMKEKLDKVSCLLYDRKFNNASFRPEIKSKISSVIDCEFVKDCKELYEKGHTKDGVYDIAIDGTRTKVFCDMTTDGGGWTIFQRRIDGSVDFHRTWEEYKNGFGNADSEYWLGNEWIHRMTKGRNNTFVRIEGMDFQGVRKHITIKEMQVEGESSKYRLHAGTFVSGEQGLVADWFYGNEQYFSTKDQDNDLYNDGNCATRYGGGWWFGSCLELNPNGRYSSVEDVATASAINWNSWHGFMKSLKSIKMQLK